MNITLTRYRCLLQSSSSFLRLQHLHSAYSHDHASSSSSSTASTARPRITTLILDLNGVLFNWDRRGSFSGIHLLQQTLPTSTWRQYERGEISQSTACTLLSPSLGAPASAINAAVEAGIASLRVEPAMAAVVAAAVQSRRRISVVAMSNAPAEFVPHLCRLYDFKKNGWGRLFMSGEVGLRKPEREFFELVRAELGLERRKGGKGGKGMVGEQVEEGEGEGEGTLFVDDLEENIALAREMGWEALLCEDVEETAERIASRLGLPWKQEKGKRGLS